MIEIMYKKHHNKDLFKSLEKSGILNTQNYIPIYQNWFSLNSSNWNNINLNHSNRLILIKNQILHLVRFHNFFVISYFFSFYLALFDRLK